MIDSEGLDMIRDFIYAKVDHLTDQSDDTWLAEKDLLSLYLQLKIIERLDDIYAEVVKLNPAYE